jgi:hypothetical protein
MHQSCNDLGTSASASEEWRSAVYSLKRIQIAPEGDDPKAFVGWVRSQNAFGFAVLDVGCNIPRITRTERDVRLDGLDSYSAVLQLAGSSAVSHNDQVAKLAAEEAER